MDIVKFFSLLFGDAGEARRLAKDANSIIESVQLGQGAEKQRDVAVLVRRTLTPTCQAVSEDSARFGPVLDELKRAHRDCRAANRDTEYTAFTLCIIYLRAMQLGDMAMAARECIDQFLADWNHIEDDTVSA